MIIELAGFHILLTGIITEKVIDSITAQDDSIGSFISLNDATEEVGRITNAYKKDDIDLTILLTHIDLDSDKQPAQMLKPEWGVDMILGGHSHSILEIPENVNNILIAQVGVGTDQIGR
ncbi:MAG: bifunctional metallophosphatase/5'-nucleotidase, partial [Candidatus Hodarchaeota archaeon]